MSCGSKVKKPCVSPHSIHVANDLTHQGVRGSGVQVHKVLPKYAPDPDIFSSIKAGGGLVMCVTSQLIVIPSIACTLGQGNPERIT